MKKLRSIIPIILSLIIVLNLTSCFLLVTKDDYKHDNGKHKGWYKAPHKSTNVIIVKPNKGNGNGHGNGHGKH